MRWPLVFVWLFGVTAVQAQGVLQPVAGPPGGNVQRLESLTAHDLLLVQDDQLLASHDGGTTWTRRLTGERVGQIIKGTSGSVYVQGARSWFRSSDDGRTWSGIAFTAAERRMATALRTPRDGWFVIEPDSGVNRGYLLRSGDEGTTWAVAKEGIGTSVQSYPMFLRLSPEGRPLLVMNPGFYLMSAALYGWDSATGAWSLLHALSGLPTDMAFADSLRGLLVTVDYYDEYSPFGGPGRLYATEDGGRTWAQRTGGVLDTLQATSVVAEGGTFYLGTQGGVFATPRADGPYQPSGPQRRVDALVPRPDGGLCALADAFSTFSGRGYRQVYCRTRGGAWIPVKPGVSTGNVKALTRSARGVLAVAEHGAFVRDSATQTWAPVAAETIRFSLFTPPDGGRNSYIAAITEAPWGRIYVLRNSVPLATKQGVGEGSTSLLALGDSVLLAQYRRGLMRSSDRGQSWRSVLEPGVTGLLRLPHDTLLALVHSFSTGAQLWVSSDLGATWRQPAQRLPTQLQALARTTTGDTLFGADQEALYRSSDRGANWVRIGSAPPGLNYGYPPPIQISHAASGALVARTPLGVFASFNQGGSWEALVESQDHTEIYTGGPPFLLEPDGRLLVATLRSGLLASAWPVAVEEEEELLRRPHRLEEAPNPFRDAVTASVTLAAPADVRAEVFDALGRRVALLHDGPAAPGTLSLRWDAGDAAPGVYVLRVQVGDTVQTARIVRVR